VTGGESGKVGFEISGSADSSFELKGDQNAGDLGFELSIEKSVTDCTGAVATTEVKDPAGTAVSITDKCGMVTTDAHLLENDPVLQEAGYFLPTNGGILNAAANVVGVYTVKNTDGTKVWVVNIGEELGEAVGGIFAAMGIMVVGIILLAVGSILACVGCCCMCMGSKS